MAKIEIDENEYAELKRVAEVANLIGKNPKARERLQEAVALAAPEQAGPEIRIRQEVTERFSSLEGKLDEFLSGQAKAREDAETDAAKRSLEGRWLDGRRKARDAGYTDEGLDKLEAYMEQKGVADHEIAIPAFERLNPPPEPVMTGGTRWNFFDQREQMANDTAYKALLEGNDDAFLGPTIQAALKESRGR